MQQVVIKCVSADTLSSILEQSSTQQQVDTGGSFVSTEFHPQFGLLTVMTSAMQEGGVVVVSHQFAEQIPAA